MTIPRIIHYCWFGGKPLPKFALRCIASWQKYMPEYELRLWNEQNFDVYSVPFVREAYHAGKYAFVSDYARLWVIHRYGGVYLDTDVELLRSLAPICQTGAWLARESNPEGYMPALGLGFALPQGHWFTRELLERYEQLRFPDPNDKAEVITIVRTTTDLLRPKGLSLEDIDQNIDGVQIYPSRYFSPKNYHTGRIQLTPDTYSIHHYDASWMPPGQKYKDRLVHRLGGIGKWLLKIKKLLRN